MHSTFLSSLTVNLRQTSSARTKLCHFERRYFWPTLLSLSSLGIIGGLTSVITSTVEGVKTEGGVSGFISGLGKGLVGTVTKPVAGALDFASETAQAVRDTATLSGPRSVSCFCFQSIIL